MTGIDLDLLRQGDRRTLAKAITLVESKLDSHRDQAQILLQSLLADTGDSLRIGISGSPGVGKSTFIEAFGLYLIEAGRKVAVLAVDPSSPLKGGSILADKTRMEELSRQDRAFIRPSPSQGTLGGVAQKTRETMLLCEAAGYDVILVETVGVGQSEVEVAGMVDFYLVLMLPNGGDELQGIKKGIMELADAVVINKADGESVRMAEQTRHHFDSAMLLLHHPEFWTPRVMTCSAQERINLDAVWQMIRDYQTAAIDGDSFHAKRADQSRQWMHKLLQEMLALKLSQNADVSEQLPLLEQQVVTGRTTPYAAARKIIDLL